MRKKRSDWFLRFLVFGGVLCVLSTLYGVYVVFSDPEHRSAMESEDQQSLTNHPSSSFGDFIWGVQVGSLLK